MNALKHLMALGLAAALLAACKQQASPMPQALQAIDAATAAIADSATDARQAVVAVIDLEEALQAIPGMQGYRTTAAEQRQMQQALARLGTAIKPKIKDFPQEKRQVIERSLAMMAAASEQ